MVPSSSYGERQPSHTATLRCPTCDHASRINGDWVLQVHPDRLGYECPECGATIDSRRDPGDLTSRSGGTLRFGSAD